MGGKKEHEEKSAKVNRRRKKGNARERKKEKKAEKERKTRIPTPSKAFKLEIIMEHFLSTLKHQFLYFTTFL